MDVQEADAIAANWAARMQSKSWNDPRPTPVIQAELRQKLLDGRLVPMNNGSEDMLVTPERARKMLDDEA